MRAGKWWLDLTSATRATWLAKRDLLVLDAGMDVDVVVVGAGHNGLICAAYLAQAGLRVLVLERRHVAGGAVCTQADLIPGYRLDVGSSVHIMIHLTPVVEELELHRYGLEYIEMDPWAWYPVPGTEQGIGFYRDVDRTCESIAIFSRRDAEAYRRFVKQWQEVNRGVFETFLHPPTPGRIVWTMFKHILRGGARARKLWSSMDLTRQLLAPYGQLVEEWFENPHVRTALLWLSAQSGPPPGEAASGDMLGWNAMIHLSGAKRAKGGSGMLSVAAERALREAGGEVRTGAPVEAVRRVEDGWEVDFSQAGGCQTVSARVVVGACHVQTFLGQLVQDTPDSLRARVRQTRIGNGFGMMVRHAVSELPVYSPEVGDGKVREYHSAMQLLCRSPEHLNSSWIDYLQGRPPADPSVVAMTFSAIDPTLAPEGGHTLFTWAQYHACRLSGGVNWDEIAEREADKLYDLVCAYAPNMRGKMLGRFIQTPAWLERELGLLRGNVMHLEMSIDQMFMWRPLPELSAYRTELSGIYLTGASTHPGGGVFGASGRSTARVILKDWRRRRVG